MIKNLQTLCEFLQLDQQVLQDQLQAQDLAQFPLRVTHSFARRMQKGNPNDPLLKQVLPSAQELIEQVGFCKDPLRESASNPLPGLLHKYHGRVLITLTAACAIHCRYCFRRHFPYQDNNPGTHGWQKIIAYLQDCTSVREVILSGGDPLTLSDALLQQFCDELLRIKHIERLRIHTRMPIVLPERIDHTFLTWFRQYPLSRVMVVHTNHAQEIDESVRLSLNDLRQTGAVILNQTVLLKDINDDAKILMALSEQLFACGVLPYYLHVLDKVLGAQAFDLPLSRAQVLHQQLREQLPGYLVPRLVREEAGALSKVWV